MSEYIVIRRDDDGQSFTDKFPNTREGLQAVQANVSAALNTIGVRELHISIPERG